MAVVPFGGGTCVTGGLAARRDGFAGLVSLDLVRMKRLVSRRPRVDDRRPRARAARPRGRGAARRGGRAARPLPAVLRVRHDRRLRGHPLVAVSPAPATAASTPWSSACGSRRRAASSGSARRPRTPPARTCASCSSARRARSASSPRSPSGSGRCPSSRSTRAGAGRRSPPAPTRCARWPRPGCCRPCSGCPTRPRPRSTWPAPTRSGASRAGGCLMITGYEGTPVRGRGEARGGHRAALRAWAARRSARRPARRGRTAGSTRRTSATRCSTSACWSRRSRRRRSGPTARRSTPA